MKKKTGLIVALIAAAGICGWWFLSQAPQQAQPKIEITKVVSGEVSYAITATGTVEPVTQINVGTQVSGIVDKLYVDYNSVVTKGQLIAEMDRITLMSELASRQASYDGSKAEFEYQQQLYNRNKTLHDKGLISDTDYEQNLYNYNRTRSTLASSKAELAKAQRNLAYTTITSPIDGVVINRAVEEGQTVAAGFETPTLFTIAADLTQMQVVANVDEADIGEVKEGQRVTFTVDAYPNDIFEGAVTQVRLEATTTSNVVTYEVVISANNPDLKLKPGLTANVNVYTIDKSNVLIVPSKALRFTPTSTLLGKHITINDSPAKHKLWILQGATYKAIPVEIGISNGTVTEVVKGIEANSEVILEAALQQAIPQTPNGGSTESNPFMPTPPGAKKK
ncbi:MAG: efflux RND transporter periplasmic adaptor subunit [Phocaeicola sp.]